MIDYDECFAMALALCWSRSEIRSEELVIRVSLQKLSLKPVNNAQVKSPRSRVYVASFSETNSKS